MLDVDPETGAIFIAQPLDYEETKMYEIHLLASDGKWEDYAVIIINIMNKNDEAPVFSINEYYGSIIEELDALPVFVLQVVYAVSQIIIFQWMSTDYCGTIMITIIQHIYINEV